MTTQLNSVATQSTIPAIIKGHNGTYPKWEPTYGPYPFPAPGDEELLRMEPESKEVYTLMSVCLAFSIWLASKSAADRQARLNYHANPVKPKDTDKASHTVYKKMRGIEVGYMEIIIASFNQCTPQENINKMAPKVERLGILTDRAIYCTAPSFLTGKSCPAKYKTLKATVKYTVTNAQNSMSDHWNI
mgnify:FL=1|tara:strand:- start:343 stop:906 length:564 start_codon:yes stop_codon:yes gene_type:complete